MCLFWETHSCSDEFLDGQGEAQSEKGTKYIHREDETDDKKNVVNENPNDTTKKDEDLRPSSTE